MTHKSNLFKLTDTGTEVNWEYFLMKGSEKKFTHFYTKNFVVQNKWKTKRHKYAHMMYWLDTPECLAMKTGTDL